VSRQEKFIADGAGECYKALIMAEYELPGFREATEAFGRRLREAREEIKAFRDALNSSDTPEEAVQNIESVRLIRSLSDDAPEM
jgi:hypothetical protein